MALAPSSDPLDAASFSALIEAAVCVAEPGSAPVLILIDLAGERAMPAAARHELAFVSAQRVAAVLGDKGFVGVLHNDRLAVLVEGTGAEPLDGLCAALLASLAQPILTSTASLTAQPVLGVAHWGSDGETAEQLFVAADQFVFRAAAETRAQLRPAPRVNFVASPLRTRSRG